MFTDSSIIYKKPFHIDLRDVDFKKKLKLSSLFSYFQDIASDAAHMLGAGFDRLSGDYGVAWVLAKIRVDILRMPEMNEEVTITTWPLPPKRVEFERDFLVTDQEGNVIIRAISSWVLIDIIERKLKRTDVIDLNYPELVTERSIDEKLKRLNNFGLMEQSYDKVIGYSDIDLNGHLNNSKYVDYIMDCFPVEEHRKHHVHSIEVQFVNEALPGHTISLYKDTSALDNGKVYIEGKSEENTKIIFKAQLIVSQVQ